MKKLDMDKLTYDDLVLRKKEAEAELSRRIAEIEAEIRRRREEIRKRHGSASHRFWTKTLPMVVAALIAAAAVIGAFYVSC